MLGAWRRDGLGQSTVLVALVVVLLLGAAALAVDWGYGLTQRRIMQNAADAAALGAGRFLATSVIEVNGDTAFTVHQEDVWCRAERYVAANPSFRPIGGTVEFTLAFGSDATPPIWTPAAVPGPGACPMSAEGASVPADTTYLRVEASVTYRTLIASVIGSPTVRAAASARARLSGTEVPTTSAPWPMVRHYDPADFDNPCPPASCDPTKVKPTTFWSPSEDDVVYGQFKGSIDPSRNSTRFAGDVPQWVTEWDATGSRFAAPQTPPKDDRSGNCGGPWDTGGNEAPSLHDKQCSIPNWFYYSYLGQLSLASHLSVAQRPGQEAPSALTERSVCDPANWTTVAAPPSCADPSAGDWVETAFGDVGSNISDAMVARIRQQGFEGAFSDKIVQAGPHKGERYGKALVVLIYLWDCGEAFNASDPVGEQWSLVLPPKEQSPDCSQVPAGGKTPTIDRVHLFTAAPFTFYEALVSSSSIEGYWGGGFGDILDCHDCPLNPLANIAFLVPDRD